MAGEFRDLHLRARWLPFRNDAAEAAPPYAIMRVTGWDATNDILKVAKPNALWSTGAVFAFNGPLEVAASGFGQATLDYPATVKYTSGTPALGETWGPANAVWTITSGNPGFTILDQLSSSNTLAIVVQSSNSTKARWIRFALPGTLAATDARIVNPGLPLVIVQTAFAGPHVSPKAGVPDVYFTVAG